jgi:hypothetical protein
MAEHAASTPDAEASDALREMNDARVAELEAKTENRVSLENAFDVLYLLTYLETVAVALGVKDQAELWFQERRGAKITEIAEQYDKMVAARDEAERIARLGGPTGRRDGVRMAPGPGGIVRPGA